MYNYIVLILSNKLINSIFLLLFKGSALESKYCSIAPFCKIKIFLLAKSEIISFFFSTSSELRFSSKRLVGSFFVHDLFSCFIFNAISLSNESLNKVTVQEIVSISNRNADFIPKASQRLLNILKSPLPLRA